MGWSTTPATQGSANQGSGVSNSLAISLSGTTGLNDFGFIWGGWQVATGATRTWSISAGNWLTPWVDVRLRTNFFGQDQGYVGFFTYPSPYAIGVAVSSLTITCTPSSGAHPALTLAAATWSRADASIEDPENGAQTSTSTSGTTLPSVTTSGASSTASELNWWGGVSFGGSALGYPTGWTGVLSVTGTAQVAMAAQISGAKGGTSTASGASCSNNTYAGVIIGQTPAHPDSPRRVPQSLVPLHRAASWLIDKQPWKERKSGLTVPGFADRRLIVPAVT